MIQLNPAPPLERLPVIDSQNTRPISRTRIRFGLGLTLGGLFVFLVGAKPEFFGADRSPVIGFIQIAVFLVGLAIICVGGYLSMMALWKDRPLSIPADFGQRFVSTGFVITVFTGMADIFGFGSHLLPEVPFFGPYQAAGVMIGELVIAIGFLMMIPYGRPKRRRL
jgi:hypothetical protein